MTRMQSDFTLRAQATSSMFSEPIVTAAAAQCLLDVASLWPGRTGTSSEQCHFDSCKRCFLTDIVTARRFTSRQGLVHVLNGQDAHSNRDSGRDLHLHDPLRTTLGHDFVVRCLAANHSTQHDDGVNVARLDERASDERQLEGAGCRSDVRDGPGCANCTVGASGEPIDNLVVPARTHDADNQVAGI